MPRVSEIPFTEKYRPQTLDEVVGNEESVNKLKNWVDDDSVPHVLLQGPAGTGKTASIVAFAKDLYGDEWESNLIQLNASDDRGIEVVRNDIKRHAEQSTAGSYSYKIIHLDEADSMCLPGDTEVIVGYPSSGNLDTKKISEVSKEGEAIPSVNFETNEVQTDRGKMLETGQTDFYEVELSDGREFLASPNHPFFIVGENEELIERELQELESGVEIADFSDSVGVVRCDNCNNLTTNKRFCSLECKNKGHSEEMTGDSNPMYGVSWDSERREKIIQKLSDGRLSGENNPNYNGEFHGQKAWNMDEDIQEEITDKISETKEDQSLSEEHRNAIARGVKRNLYGEYVGEEYSSQNYRYHLKDKEQVKCEICGETKKVGGADGIYVHHKDGNQDNHSPENLMNVCPMCHNFICHDRWEDIADEDTENWYKQEVISDGGRKAVDTVEIESIDFSHTGKAYNITMEDTPNFLLANGILTHNTNDAMNALRRIMERYSDQTRFFLSCNYSNKIIDPILSRCVNLPFSRLEDNEIQEILENIVEQEDLETDQEALDEIIDYVEGDARRAVHSLQMSIDDGQVTAQSLEFVNLQPGTEEVGEIVELAVNGQIEKAMNMNIRDVQPEVIDHSQFCKDVMSVLKKNESINDDVRFYMMSQVADMERNILEGCSATTQVNSFLAKLPVIQYSNIPNYQDDS